MLLLEARSSPGYFDSQAFRLIKQYAQIITDIIEEGVENGEIRDDISPRHIRQIILGSMDHLCLAGVIFDREISTDTISEDLFEILFQGIKKEKD